MSEPIFNPLYWKNRLLMNPKDEDRYKSVYICTSDVWEEIAERHKRQLLEAVREKTSILDAGCGYGRLLTLLPEYWKGRYLGLDISPDFIHLAKKEHPERAFRVADLRKLSFLDDKSFDLAILISIKHMVVANMGGDVWAVMEEELNRVCKDVLILEYSE